MPKLVNRLPKYCRDKNQAVVYINDGKIPLGRYGSDESKKEYSRILAEFANIGSVIDHKQKASCSVAKLCTEFLVWAKEHKGKSDYGNFFTAVQMVMKDHSHTLVKDFGPRALKTVQGQFVKHRWKTKKDGVEKRYSRNFCNKLTRFIRHIFKWGVERELVPYHVYEALKSVTPVTKREAKNRPPRKPVPYAVIKRTLPYLNPVVADMVCVQLFAAMRPGEVCRIRPCDIDRSREEVDGVWLYLPSEHMTDWHEQTITKVISLCKSAQEILERRMQGKAQTDYIFTPADAMREKWERDAANRKSKITPSQQARKEKRANNPKAKFRPCYTSESYGKSITRTIANLPEGEKIPHWTAYELRHAELTRVGQKYGVDAARAVAGHSSANITLGYCCHGDVDTAIQIAKEHRNPFE